MTATLTQEERTALIDIAENPSSADRSSAVLEKFREIGILMPAQNGRDELTNRGIAHLVVDCKKTLHEIIALFPAKFADAAVKKEYEQVKAHLRTEANMDIFYFHTFKLYIEWDMFDPDTNDFRHLQMRDMQKVQLEIASRLLDDRRVPVDNILSVLGVPKGMISAVGMDHNAAKAIISQMLNFY